MLRLTVMLLRVGPMEPATKRGLRAVENSSAACRASRAAVIIELVRFAIHAVIHQVALGAVERIGLDDIRAGFQIRAMDAQHHIGARLHQDFVAALQRRPAEIRGREMLLLQHGAHGAVDDQNTAIEGIEQGFTAFVGGGHGDYFDSTSYGPRLLIPLPDGRGSVSRSR